MGKRKEARQRTKMETQAKDFAVEFAKSIEANGPSNTASGELWYMLNADPGEFSPNNRINDA